MCAFVDRWRSLAVGDTVHCMTPRAIIYGRQSKGDFTSIEDQINRQNSDVLRQGWSPAETLQDGVSASRYGTKVRDDWPKLLVRIESGEVQYVCFWDSSRGSRDAGEWLSFLKLCERMNVQIRLTGNETTYDMRNAGDWKALASEGVDSDSFSRKRSRDTLRGVTEKAMRGGPPGKMLYGYLRLRNEMGKVQEQVPHPQRAEVVRRIFKECSEGRSLARICDDLNAEGIASPNGSIWRHATLRRIMTNRGYLGERWLNRVHVGKAMWPAIVEPDVFASVGEILADPDRRTNNDGNFKHWLSGLARCGRCEGPMQVERKRGVQQYRCKSRGCTMIPKAVLEDFVADEVRDRMLKMVEKPSDPAKHARRKAALSEIKRLQGLIDQAASDLVSGKATDYALAQAVSKNAQDAIEVQRRIAEANISDKVVLVLKTAGADWFGLDPEQKRTVAASLVVVKVMPVGRVGRVLIPAEERVVVDDAEVEEVEV
jgi:DNA invertase Pin-like site-specific DNA recombinase